MLKCRLAASHCSDAKKNPRKVRFLMTENAPTVLSMGGSKRTSPDVCKRLHLASNFL